MSSLAAGHLTLVPQLKAVNWSSTARLRRFGIDRLLGALVAFEPQHGEFSRHIMMATGADGEPKRGARRWRPLGARPGVQCSRQPG